MSKTKGNKIEIKENYAIIYASNSGQEIFCNIDDLDLLDKYTWQSFKTKKANTFYARAYIWDSEKREKRIFLHQLLYESNEFIIDHIDRNGLNNKRENLRLATRSENRSNSKKFANNTSGYIGVYFRRNKWEVQITKNGKSHYIGVFNSIIEAAKAYDIMALKLNGNFAHLNFPIDIEN